MEGPPPPISVAARLHWTGDLQISAMIEIVRTNDPVVISFVEALMRDAGIAFLVADQNMSVMEGTIGILARRILVGEEDAERAREVLVEAGVAHEIRQG